MDTLSIADAQLLWSPDGTYLNTASYGLPPRPARHALQAALEDWQNGRTSWEHWGAPGEEARASFARLLGVPVETVAIAANVSTLVGLVAASIPGGSRVLAPEVEFTSILFPFLVQDHEVFRYGSFRLAGWRRRSATVSTSSRSAPSRWPRAKSPTSTASRGRQPSTA